MLNKKIFIMDEMIFLIRSFLAGSACGILGALICAFIKKIGAFKKEEEPTSDDVFKWVLIGALLGGCFATLVIKH